MSAPSKSVLALALGWLRKQPRADRALLLARAVELDPELAARTARELIAALRQHGWSGPLDPRGPSSEGSGDRGQRPREGAR